MPLALRSATFAKNVSAPLFFFVLLLPTFAGGQSPLPTCSTFLPASSWDNCQGTITFADGGKYVGEFRGGVSDGQGILTYPDGYKYVGEYRNGRQNGQGTLTFPSGEHYVGGFRNGDRSGRGTLTFSSGNKYVGDFKNDKLNGQAIATYPDGHSTRRGWIRR
jgi:hypothetical protein